jgi:hypothetical protein
MVDEEKRRLLLEQEFKMDDDSSVACETSKI